jgi:microcystin-dependent protein
LPEAAFVPGTTILSAAVNDDFSDIAAALTDSVAADGQTNMTGTLKAQAGAAATPGYGFVGLVTTGFYANSTAIGVTINGVASAFFSGNGVVNVNNVPTTIPVGFIGDFAGAAAPSGWRLCDGSVVSQTTLALLFAVIGTTYNTGGEGAGNFRLPDYRGRNGFGLDNMGGTPANRITNAVSGIAGTTLGAAGGAQSVTITTSYLPASAPTLSGTVTPTLSGTVTPTLSGTVTPTLSGTVTPTITISGNIVNFTPNAGGAPAIQTLNAAGAGNSPITPSTTAVNGASFAVSAVLGSSFAVSTVNGSSFASSTVNGSSFIVSNLGSGNAMPVMPPTIMVNKIIFAGA